MKWIILFLATVILAGTLCALSLHDSSLQTLVKQAETQNQAIEKLRKRVGNIEKELGINPMSAPTGVKEIR